MDLSRINDSLSYKEEVLRKIRERKRIQDSCSSKRISDSSSTLFGATREELDTALGGIGLVKAISPFNSVKLSEVLQGLTNKNYPVKKPASVKVWEKDNQMINKVKEFLNNKFGEEKASSLEVTTFGGILFYRNPGSKRGKTAILINK